MGRRVCRDISLICHSVTFVVKYLLDPPIYEQSGSGNGLLPAGRFR
nr:MAG TPA: hypothetical protein [Caudoviricetes sp.]